MSRLIGIAVLVAVSACGRDRGGAPPGTDGGVTTRDGAIPGADGGGPGRDGDIPMPDGGWPAATTVTCIPNEGPTLVVTRPIDVDREGRTTLRATLRFDGAASGIAITSVEQLDAGGALARAWDVASLAGPAGFDGSVTPREGYPDPRVRFTATADAIGVELDACDREAWDRALGSVIVRGTSDQTGDFEATCWLAAADALAPLSVACARGLPGFIGDAFDALADPSVPYDVVLIEGRPTAMNGGAAPVDGYVATEVEVRARPYEHAFPPCPDPGDWRVSGGTHRLWRGMTSEDVWSGPVAPGAEETVWYMWQAPGSAPPGLCVPPFDGTPTPETCYGPTLALVLRGTSSAGEWEWESDPFSCLTLGP